MPAKIEFSMPVSNDESDLLCSILKIQKNDLSDHLSLIAIAALEEYLKMITGQKVFTRGSDMLNYRLLLIIKHYYGGRIPDEQQISGLFQTTSSESRSMVKSITAKYQYALKEMVDKTLKKEVEGISAHDKFRYVLVTSNAFAKERLNTIISRENATVEIIESDPRRPNQHLMNESTYLLLCKYFDLHPKPLKK